MIQVRLTVPLYATEEPEKVLRAVLNIFPDAKLEVGETEIAGTSGSLERFGFLLREQAIRSSARGVFFRKRDGCNLRFSLSKQAAFAGKVNFGLKAPLGNIEVEIESDDLDGIIDELAPNPERADTDDGKGDAADVTDETNETDKTDETDDADCS